MSRMLWIDFQNCSVILSESGTGACIYRPVFAKTSPKTELKTSVWAFFAKLGL